MKSAFEMLSRLPEVFDLRDLSLLIDAVRLEEAPHAVVAEATRDYASRICWRWKKAGMIEPAGPKVGVFYNRVKDPQRVERKDLVLGKVFYDRLFVVAGANALNDAGWTTQIPRMPELAVYTSRDIRSIPQIDGVKIEGRTASWFAAVYSQAQPGLNGLPTIRPEHALVDTVRMRSQGIKSTLWVPAPDDISLVMEDDLPSVLQRILKAAEELGVDREDVVAYVEGTRDFETGAFDELDIPSMSP